MDVEIKVNSNIPAITAELEAKIEQALEMCGLVAEGYAKKLCPVDTGDLRNSIGYVVDMAAMECYIGTNVEYAAYVELGTGQFYTGTGGRDTPWVYSFHDTGGNEQSRKTVGNRPQPYLKPAIADHAAKYQKIIRQTMSS